MFTELLPLLERRQLLLTITQIKGPLVRVTLTPLKTKEGEDQSLTTPLIVEGTVDELDRDLGKQLSVFTASHSQLESTLTEAKAEMDAAAKAARDKAKKATAPATAKPAETAVPAKEEVTAPAGSRSSRRRFHPLRRRRRSRPQYENLSFRKELHLPRRHTPRPGSEYVGGAGAQFLCKPVSGAGYGGDQRSGKCRREGAIQLHAGNRHQGLSLGGEFLGPWQLARSRQLRALLQVGVGEARRPFNGGSDMSRNRKQDLIAQIANPATNQDGSLDALIRRYLECEDSQQASSILFHALSRASTDSPLSPGPGVWPLVPS